MSSNENNPIDEIKSNGRELEFVSPNHEVHHVTADYVQVTKDGKYILSYTEHTEYDGNVPCFTELLYKDGEWSKCPFHKDLYEQYDFEGFDQELSDAVINELPKYVYMRMLVNGAKGDVYIPKKEGTTEDILQDTGATIVQKKNNSYYMVLLANAGDDVVNRFPNDGVYMIEFPFPVYTLDGVSSHSKRETTEDIDVNHSVDYKELEYQHAGIPISVRRKIAAYLENDTQAVFEVSKLPLVEVTSDDGEIYSVHFVSCPNLETFNEIYKADKVFVDYDMRVASSYNSDFEKALHGEVPATFVRGDGVTQTNGVSHTMEHKDISVSL